jgi:ubiquitin C-terminal hydrolase
LVVVQEKEPGIRFWVENPEVKQAAEQEKADKVTSADGDMSQAAVLVPSGGAAGPTVQSLDSDQELPNANGTSPAGDSNSSAAPKRKIEPYIQLTAEQYKQQLESFQFAVGAPILVERRNSDGSWRRIIVEKDWRNFEVGDIIDACDSVNKWYESTVRDVKEDKLFIHFNNWASTWDDWIPRDSDRLAKKNTHTNGPRQTNSTSSAGSYSGLWSMGGYGNNHEGKPDPSGAVGFQNLGNTCFMNSVLQSMAHAPILTDYFLEDQYVPHVNRNNPLGWQGKVVDEYAQLIKDYWSDKYTVIAPRAFKNALGEFAPRFSGYQQQDSSELLSFLLDGLHEDLNLIKVKPPTNAVESNDRADSVMSAEAWQVYQLRNKSIIVDSLQGQLKSKLVCPEASCGKISITFDPYMFLSVPLPVMDQTKIPVHFVFADRKKPITLYGVVVSKVARIPELKQALSALTGIPANRMIAGDYCGHKLFRFLDSECGCSEINRSDVTYVYEVPATEQFESEKEFAPVQLVHRQIVKNEHHNPNFPYSKPFTYQNFGLPRVILVPKKQAITAKQLKQQVEAAILASAKAETALASLETEILTYHSDGRNCYQHENMFNNCPGCQLSEETDQPFTIKIDRSDGDVNLLIAVVWKAVGENNEYQYDEEFDRNIVKDDSVDSELSSNRGQEGVQLLDCVKAFAKPEVLGAEDMWYCGKCKDFKQASKEMSIYSLPDLLIIHLKRFSYTKMNRDKINTLVNFPLEGLDMSQYVLSESCKQSAVYDCFAVSNHFGGMGGGHYNAFCRNLVNNQWYCHDDSSVSKVENTSSIISSSAYVLFYKLRSLKSHQHKAANNHTSTQQSNGVDAITNGLNGVDISSSNNLNSPTSPNSSTTNTIPANNNVTVLDEYFATSSVA